MVAEKQLTTGVYIAARGVELGMSFTISYIVFTESGSISNIKFHYWLSVLKPNKLYIVARYDDWGNHIIHYDFMILFQSTLLDIYLHIYCFIFYG